MSSANPDRSRVTEAPATWWLQGSSPDDDEESKSNRFMGCLAPAAFITLVLCVIVLLIGGTVKVLTLWFG